MDEREEQKRWFLENLQPHEDMLRAWLQSRFGALCDVDDLIQEAYFRVFQAHSAGTVKSPKAFLFATARNLALDKVRHSSVSRTLYVEQNELLEFPDCGMGVPEIVARNQELEILTKAIQSMPNRCRQIFTLRKVYGMSQQRIAEKLCISRNTVSAQLTIGIRRFTRFMEAYCTKEDRSQ